MLEPTKTKKPFPFDLWIGFLSAFLAFCLLQIVMDYQSSHCTQGQNSGQENPNDQQNAKSGAAALHEQGDDRNTEERSHAKAKPSLSISCGVLGFPTALMSIMDEHEGFFIGFFTFVLAVSTTLLWRSTERLWKAGERQIDAVEGQLTEMQQSFAADRAHLLLGSFQGYETGIAPQAMTRFIFKNYGRSPALVRMLAARHEYGHSFPIIQPMGHVPGFTDQSGQIPSGSVIIKPDDGTMPVIPLLSATAEQIEKARNGDGSIYTRAVIVYDDVRGKQHETSVCLVYFFRADSFLVCTEKGANYHT